MRDLDVPPFAVPGTDWRPVAPALARARLVVLAVVAGLLAVVAAVIAWLTLPWVWTALALPVVIGAWGLWLIPRQVKAISYAERSDDFLLRQGVLFRKMAVVPYGRMQYVDVSAGPLARKFGIATLELHTAAAGLDVQVPGLSAAEAERLREQLGNLGQSRSAGL